MDRRAVLVTTSVALAASAATYAWGGYQYGVWPQPGLLESVFAYSGQLQGDWFTALPPAHWALAHALALLPQSALEPTIGALWIAGLLTLWAAATFLVRDLGSSAIGGITVALLAFPTHLDGVGLSTALSDFMYPTTLAFAVGFGGITALASDRPAAAGLLLGLATALHPNVGLLIAAVSTPGLLAYRVGRRRAAVRFSVGLIALAVYPLVRLILDKGISSSIPAGEAYTLFAVVRIPHHALYRAFPAGEYLHTIAWLAVLVAAWPLLAPGVARRCISVVTAATVLVAMIGGVASEVRWPLVLVEALTSRITPLIVLVGICSGVAALGRRLGAMGVAIGVLIFVVTHSLRVGVADPGACEAFLLAIILLFTRRFTLRSTGLPQPVSVVVALGVAGTVLISAHGWRTSLSEQDREWRSVGAATHSRTRPGTLILTPPDLDGFRFYARRPIVVDFGSFPFGRGTKQWVNRMLEVSNDPLILSGKLPADVPARLSRLAADYDRATARSPRAACRYGARFVVTRAATAHPRWLTPVYANPGYVLSRLKDGTCKRGSV